MSMKTIVLIILIAIVGCFHSCNELELRESTYRYFKGTNAEDLAYAVNEGDTIEIERILSESPELLDSRDSVYEMTLLMHTIWNQTRVKYPLRFIVDAPYSSSWESNREQLKSFRFLLNKGANVNYQTKKGWTPLILASMKKYGNIEIVKLLIERGAEVNAEAEDPGYSHDRGRFTPLMFAVHINREDIAELLLNNGANIDYVNKVGKTALGAAIHTNSYYEYHMAMFLLIHGADYTKPYSISGYNQITLVRDLRERMYELDSDEHKQKMEIVDYLREKGIDYKKVPIPEKVVKYAKRKYPDSWQEYLDNY